jgi:hypothetical protein
MKESKRDKETERRGREKKERDSESIERRHSSFHYITTITFQ